MLDWHLYQRHSIFSLGYTDKEQVKNIIVGENMLVIQPLKLIETRKDVDVFFELGLFSYN